MKKIDLSIYTDRELDELRSLISQEFHKRYKTVEIFNRNGCIASLIESETGFQCYHKYMQQEYTMGIGTNYIQIPRNVYTKKLEQSLIDKYNNV